MFQKRKNSQKPSEELITRFKENFPLAGPPNDAQSQQHMQQALLDLQLPDSSNQPRQPVGLSGAKGSSGLTPRAKDDQWYPTPSLLDPTLLGFNLLGKSPGCPSSPASANTLYHRAAGDLHLANAAMDVLTPTCAPTTLPSFQWSSAAVSSGGQVVAGQSLVGQANVDGRFSEANNVLDRDLFATRDVLAGLIDPFGNPSLDNLNPDLDLTVDEAVHTTAGFVQTGSVLHNTEGFRYHAAIHAPTAMTENSDEDPVSYLNKGQPYALTIEDKGLQVPSFHLPRYRTYVWISFNDPERRSMPDTWWQLWKENRGINEAQQSGNKLAAVEFIPAGQHNDGYYQPGQVQHAWTEIEAEAYNGFSVLWGPSTSNPRPECSMHVRFNFVSTDFTRAKGVKGIPVRFCTMTEEISLGSVGTAAPEVSYCITKMFRDHGAARKIANDTLQVKRKIEKIKQNMKLPDARKQRGSKYDLGVDDDDDQAKLALLEEKLSSAQPISPLNLRGDDSDRPRFSPVPGQDEMEDVQYALSAGREIFSEQSFASVQSVAQSFDNPQTGSIEVSGHQAIIQNINVGTSRRQSTAVAHFYIRTQSERYYRAIYLAERTVQDFINTIAGKYSVDAGHIHLALRIDQKGRQIVVDDEVVRAVPEGQDMVVEFSRQEDDDDTPTKDEAGQISTSSGLEIRIFF